MPNLLSPLAIFKAIPPLPFAGRGNRSCLLLSAVNAPPPPPNAPARKLRNCCIAYVYCTAWHTLHCIHVWQGRVIRESASRTHATARGRVAFCSFNKNAYASPLRDLRGLYQNASRFPSPDTPAVFARCATYWRTLQHRRHVVHAASSCNSHIA
jgi:hypothetical protein